MIILMFLNGIYLLFTTLTSAINIPNMPSQVEEVAMTIGDYISMGTGILSVYTDLPYLLTLFGLIVAMDITVMLYKFIMWVIRKIPVANIH